MNRRITLHASGDSTPAVRGLGSADDDLLPLFLLRYDRPNTRRSYTNDLQSFFGSEFITLHQASGVTFVDVNAYVERLQSAGYAPSTQRRQLASIRGFFSWLVSLGALDSNPADPHLVRRIARTGGSDRAITVLTKEQARALVDAVDMDKSSGARDRALILTLLHCVLRRSEAAAMDFEHIRQVGAHTVLDIPSAKGGSNQYVKMPQYIKRLILDMSTVYGLNSGAVWRSLSPNSKGKRLSGTSIYRIVHDASKRAGIQGMVGAHTLRHTGCTLAIESGATVQQVQAHARHKNLETTMIYVHQRDRLADSAADYIDLAPEAEPGRS
ncbi:MAG: tyrosine-type recombinase/integrase [Bacteroidota bacterium]